MRRPPRLFLIIVLAGLFLSSSTIFSTPEIVHAWSFSDSELDDRWIHALDAMTTSIAEAYQDYLAPLELAYPIAVSFSLGKTDVNAKEIGLNEFQAKTLYEFAYRLVSRLSSFEKIEFVEREHRDILLRELELQTSSLFDPTTAARLGRQRGAEKVLFVQIAHTPLKTDLIMHLKILDVEEVTADRVFSVNMKPGFEANGGAGSLKVLMRRFGVKMAPMLSEDQSLELRQEIRDLFQDVLPNPFEDPAFESASQLGEEWSGSDGATFVYHPGGEVEIKRGWRALATTEYVSEFYVHKSPVCTEHFATFLNLVEADEHVQLDRGWWGNRNTVMDYVTGVRRISAFTNYTMFWFGGMGVGIYDVGGDIFGPKCWRVSNDSQYCPMRGVTYHGAKAYCDYFGLEVISEAQWVIAHRDEILKSWVAESGFNEWTSTAEVSGVGGGKFVTRNPESSTERDAFSPDRIDEYNLGYPTFSFRCVKQRY